MMAWGRNAACAPLVVAVVLALAGPAAAQEDEGDPLEPINRGIFEFNRVLDGLILEPAARMYRMFLPRLVRDGVANVLDNARTPVILVNDLLQGEWERAETTTGRFMFNTVLGVGGIIDFADFVGMPEHHDEDFGQTLAVHGVGSGPYLMLPIFGPSNARDAAGRVVDVFTDPIALFAPVEASVGRSGAEGLTLREQNIETVEELERTSLDFYAATRTLARQLRANAIRNGRAAPIEDIYDESIFEEDFDEDFEDPAFEDPAADEDFEDPALEDPAADGDADAQ